MRPTKGQTTAQRHAAMTTPEMVAESHDPTANSSAQCPTCSGSLQHAREAYDTMADHPGDPVHKAAHIAAAAALNRHRHNHWVVTGRRAT